MSNNMEIPKLNMAQTLADLEIFHETKGRDTLHKLLREQRDKGVLSSIIIHDFENDFSKPRFRVELEGSNPPAMFTFLSGDLTKAMTKLGYTDKKLAPNMVLFTLSDNTPLAKSKPLNLITHGDIYDIKQLSGSELFNAEVAARAILGLKEDRESAKDALRAIKNGTYYRDLGVGTSMDKSESVKFESALYSLHQLLQEKGM